MKEKRPFSLKERLRSFGYAFRGLSRFFKTEHNLWIHLAATFAAVLLGFVFHISANEWLAILIVIGMVISAEAFNTCIEKIMDHLAPGRHDNVRYIKDLAAGAVLVTAVVAAIVGIIVFLPKITGLF